LDTGHCAVERNSGSRYGRRDSASSSANITDQNRLNLDPVVRFETPPGKQMQVDFTTISPSPAQDQSLCGHAGILVAPLTFGFRTRAAGRLAGKGIEEACHLLCGVPQNRNIIT